MLLVDSTSFTTLEKGNYHPSKFLVHLLLREIQMLALVSMASLSEEAAAAPAPATRSSGAAAIIASLF